MDRLVGNILKDSHWLGSLWSSRDSEVGHSAVAIGVGGSPEVLVDHANFGGRNKGFVGACANLDTIGVNGPRRNPGYGLKFATAGPEGGAGWGSG